LTGKPYSLVVNTGEQPSDAVLLGFQNDGAGSQALALAHFSFGYIPGKAKDLLCWYSYAGVERDTSDFSWVVAAKDVLTLQKNDGSGAPHNALKVQRGTEPLSEPAYSAVAHHELLGTIPGKARDNTCWFPYGGREHQTASFSWVVVSKQVLIASFKIASVFVSHRINMYCTIYCNLKIAQRHILHKN